MKELLSSRFRQSSVLSLLFIGSSFGAAVAQTDTPVPPAQPQPTSPPPVPTTGAPLVVNGKRADVETAVDRRSYSVAKDLQATTGNIADVLRNIPSLQVDLQGHVSLRGDPNVTVLIDGKPSSQFSGDSLAQALQTLPASQIDRVEVMTNPSAEFRADGSGGIINLIMKKAKGTGPTAAIRIQASTGGRALATANFGFNSNKLSTVADVSFRADRQTPVTVNLQSSPNPVTGVSDYNRDVDRGRLAQEIVDAHVASDYDVSAKTRVSGALRFSYFHGDQPSTDQFEQDGDTGAPIAEFTRLSAQQGTQYNGVASTSVRHTWGEGGQLVLTGTYDLSQYKRQRFDQLTPTLPTGPEETAAFERHTHNQRPAFMADYQTPLPGSAKLKLGYDFEYSGTTFEHAAASGGPAGATTPDPSQTGTFIDDETHNQVYVTYERPFGKLDALIGLRGEVLQLALDEKTASARSDQDYERLYPSLHLSYDLTGGRKVTASYSKRVDRPSYALLDPIPYPQNPGFVFEGNSDLKPQDTDSFELGFEKRTEVSSFLATFYYRQTHDAFSYLYADLPDGGLLQRAANVGDQRNVGLEVVLANKLTPTLTYNLSADAYWTEISAPNLGFAQTEQTVTGFGRANLSWQMTTKDALQLNFFVNGKTLLPQGYVQPFASGNLGYRHAVNDAVSWMFVVQDPFNGVRTREVLSGLGGTDRRLDTSNTRLISLTLVWSFSGKSQNADFDFKPGGYGAVSTP